MGTAEAIVDYSTVTELSGARGSQAQLARMYQRYYFAGQFCEGKDVLEIACGAGQGLGYLARRARCVVGIDINDHVLALARNHYGSRVDIRQMDAEALSFPDASFDTVVNFEAIYYLPRPERFASEVRRVLRPGGILVLCTTNKDLPDFNPSPFSHQYFGPPELVALLAPHGFAVECFAADPVGPLTLRGHALRTLKRAAVQLDLIPKTMRGKELLKRMVFGSLVELPREIPEGESVESPKIIPVDGPDKEHHLLFAVARRLD
jgi:SAM-dependent methyltransferase